jgi:hypothetical protein
MLWPVDVTVVRRLARQCVDDVNSDVLSLHHPYYKLLHKLVQA